jgi:hypothetical protein
MSYGFELRAPNGTDVWMTTANFGLMVADVFDVTANTSGSKSYTNLNWHNNIYAQETSNISGSIFSRTLSSHSFVNITVSVDGSNVPTISWSPHNSRTACIGGENNDTTAYEKSTGSYRAHLCASGDKRPDVRIVVMVG